MHDSKKTYHTETSETKVICKLVDWFLQKHFQADGKYILTAFKVIPYLGTAINLYHELRQWVHQAQIFFNRLMPLIG